MDLVLWRHADAQPGTPDATRELTAKGIKQAERMGRWLDQKLPEHALILVSPAERAQQTACGLERRFKTVEALAPSGTAAGILAAVDWPDAHETVVVVGHQPALGSVAALLLSGHESPWTIRKGALWWLSRRTRESMAEVIVRCVIGPDCV